MSRDASWVVQLRAAIGRDEVVAPMGLRHAVAARWSPSTRPRPISAGSTELGRGGRRGGRGRDRASAARVRWSAGRQRPVRPRRPTEPRPETDRAAASRCAGSSATLRRRPGGPRPTGRGPRATPPAEAPPSAQEALPLRRPPARPGRRVARRRRTGDVAPVTVADSATAAGPNRGDAELTGEILAALRAEDLVCGVAAAEPFADTRAELFRRRAAGLHGGMAFTYRNPERSTDPAPILGGARSLVVGALGYLRDPPPAIPTPSRPGRVARYAWSDVYADLTKRLGPGAARAPGGGLPRRRPRRPERAGRPGRGAAGRARLVRPQRQPAAARAGVVVRARLDRDRRRRSSPLGAGPRRVRLVHPVPARLPDRGHRRARRRRRPALPGLAAAGDRAVPASSTGRRWATASTAATTARRCARPNRTAAPDGRRRRRAGAGLRSTWSTCSTTTTPTVLAAAGRWYIAGAQGPATCGATRWSCSATTADPRDPRAIDAVAARCLRRSRSARPRPRVWAAARLGGPTWRSSSTPPKLIPWCGPSCERRAAVTGRRA